MYVSLYVFVLPLLSLFLTAIFQFRKDHVKTNKTKQKQKSFTIKQFFFFCLYFILNCPFCLFFFFSSFISEKKKQLSVIYTDEGMLNLRENGSKLLLLLLLLFLFLMLHGIPFIEANILNCLNLLPLLDLFPDTIILHKRSC